MDQFLKMFTFNFLQEELFLSRSFIEGSSFVSRVNLFFFMVKRQHTSKFVYYHLSKAQSENTSM